MTSREHHFVPQFYLRQFSADGRCVNLFNFKHGRAILGVSIKHQCSRRNYYGFAENLESGLARLEGATAGVLRRIRAIHTLPAPGSLEWHTLLTFIVFQKLRTTNAGRMDDAMTDYLAKMQLEGRPEFKDIKPDSFEVRNVHPVAIAVSVASEMVPEATDLQWHLFVSNAPRSFITSDDPVVAHNQYCEGINYRGVTGWSCRGLQIFWPISPTELLLLFDAAVYKVGGSHRGQQVTTLTAPGDIDQMNTLQILNAHHNAYFVGNFAPTQCHALAARRPSKRHAFVETNALPNAEGGTSALMHAFSPLLPVKLTVSAISVRKKARQVLLEVRGGLYRNARERFADEGLDHGLTPAGPYTVKRIIRK